MKAVFNKIIAPLSAAVLLFSCSKKDNPATPATGSGKVKMEFFNNVGSSTLNLNSQWYKNEHGDSFKVSKFNYYISNIKLTGSNVSYTEPDSYHLMQQSEASAMSFDMAAVPAGTYSAVTLTIGVDSLHNVSGAQTGALDPANGMFWTWNTGYIMLKFEGTSPVSPQADGGLVFHAGGFAGANSVVRTVTLNLSAPITVSATNNNHVHLTADVLALFRSPSVIDFATYSSMQEPGANAKKLADNYANMFSVTYAGL